ncbi:hypothetical protein GKE82_23665 [Conexibacter sp. W3-3-2]|uniref:hypothetical protein n=1 Tax=Conexibacter sp. W3-3-2 TaxID=2675227 RepID=UPI0012B8B109|nr:hypothetical protein [Conexibacter sp. W3-3-2]MTD47204.1 hypothetical protein [Conexibacter sp. W3-3-2]
MAAGMTLAAAAPATQAAPVNVHLCHIAGTTTPLGTPSGLTPEAFDDATATLVNGGCDSAQGRLRAETTRPDAVGGSAGVWRYTAPADTTITALRMRRQTFGLSGAAGSGAAFGRYTLQTHASTLELREPGAATGDVSGEVEFPGLSTSSVRFTAGCALDGFDRCQNIVAAEVPWMRITLEDPAAPTVQNAAGSLLQDAVLSGTVRASYDGADVGTGLLESVVVVDGVDHARQPLSPGVASCQELTSSDSTRDYRTGVPCLTARDGATVSLDTTTIADGTHTVSVFAVDAAGQRTPLAAARSVTVRNAPPCRDGVDNDGDGRVDTADPACHTDGNPANPGSYDPGRAESPDPECADGQDNDRDGRVDTADPACHSDGDPGNPATYVPGGKESPDPACSNGQDDDGDGLADSADPGCRNALNVYVPGDGDERNPGPVQSTAPGPVTVPSQGQPNGPACQQARLRVWLDQSVRGRDASGRLRVLTRAGRSVRTVTLPDTVASPNLRRYRLRGTLLCKQGRFWVRASRAKVELTSTDANGRRFKSGSTTRTNGAFTWFNPVNYRPRTITFVYRPDLSSSRVVARMSVRYRVAPGVRFVR